MASVRLCDEKPQLYQWDTGVQLELCECDTANEMHFVTASGLIKRDVVDGICDVPDVALQQAGLLVVYAYTRDEIEGSTRHEFRLRVFPRPKPADYIDPPDEADNLEQLAERVAGMIDTDDLNINLNLKNGQAEASLRGLNAAMETDEYKLAHNALAIGRLTKASGYNSFASGETTTASGRGSHAEGVDAIASGNWSHAEGQYTLAKGTGSHAEGAGTIATAAQSHAQGRYSVEDAEGKYAHIVGNGLNSKQRSNAHTLDWGGNAWYAGYVEGTSLILPSPNGTRWKITVTDAGTLDVARVDE